MAMRAPSSPGCGVMHITPTSAVSRAVSTSAGAALMGRGPKSSRSNPVERAPVVQCGGDAGCDSAAGFIGNQSDVFAGTHTKTRFHGVPGAGHQVRLWQTKLHPNNST